MLEAKEAEVLGQCVRGGGVKRARDERREGATAKAKDYDV